MYTYPTSHFWRFILLFTVIGWSAAHAQTTRKGQILAEDTHRPVPYTLITDPQHRFGIYADGNGHFTAHIPQNVDTLLITCVGYAERLIPLADSMVAQTIYLRSKPKELAEVVVRGKKPRLMVLGAIRKKAPIIWGNCSGRNIEFALYIRNPKSADAYLQRVSYLIARGGVPSAPFRVRIYENIDGEPGRDLLAQSLIATARRANSWCEVDLSSFQIPFPKEGLFVAMEWLPTDESEYKFSTSFRMPDAGWPAKRPGLLWPILGFFAGDSVSPVLGADQRWSLASALHAVAGRYGRASSDSGQDRAHRLTLQQRMGQGNTRNAQINQLD